MKSESSSIDTYTPSAIRYCTSDTLYLVIEAEGACAMVLEENVVDKGIGFIVRVGCTCGLGVGRGIEFGIGRGTGFCIGTAPVFGIGRGIGFGIDCAAGFGLCRRRGRGLGF